MGKVKDQFIAEAEAAGASLLTLTSEPLFFKFIGIMIISNVVTAIHANSINDLTRKIINTFYQDIADKVTIHYSLSEQNYLQYTVNIQNLETNETTEEILRIYKIHKHLIS